MKKLIVPILAIVAFVAVSACKTDVVEPRDPSVHSSTTTTEESSTRRPVDATTTTETRSSN
jgi:hypothetical protein